MTTRTTDRTALLRAARAVCTGNRLSKFDHPALNICGWYSCNAIHAATGFHDLVQAYTVVYERDGLDARHDGWESDRTCWWLGDTRAEANQEARTYALLLFREALGDFTP